MVLPVSLMVARMSILPMTACDDVIWFRRLCGHALRAQSSHPLNVRAGPCLSKLNLLSSMAWLSTPPVPSKNLHLHTQLLHLPCRLASAQKVVCFFLCFGHCISRLPVNSIVKKVSHSGVIGPSSTELRRQLGQAHCVIKHFQSL